MHGSPALLSTMNPAPEYTDTTVYGLPDPADTLRWGLHVIAAGASKILPGSSYPPKAHPDEYLFSWKKGRVLNEYQLIYISSGAGVFESAQTEKISVEAGQVLLLFPGVWHRYKPNTKLGWDENWVAFTGDAARRIMIEYFTPDRPLIQVGENQELLELVSSTIELMQKAPPGYQHRAAARIMDALAIIELKSPISDTRESEYATKIQNARLYFAEHFEQLIEMHAFAQQLGFSYSLFRKLFKENTGMAPQKYLIDIRIAKARELLRHTKLSVTEIGQKTGFCGIYFFSRLFKKWEGISPLAYRKRVGERF